MDDVGQLICVGFAGGSPPDELLAAIRNGRVCGVILFARNIISPTQTGALVARLQAESPTLPLLITIDQEGGKVQRLKTRTWPPAETLGAGSPSTTRQSAHAMAIELAAIGCNVDFAPVLDVLVERSNPVMAGRCFSSDPSAVAAHGEAFIRGLHDAGIAACGKHFPGHGRTLVDSHETLPEVSATLDELRQSDLVPFRRAIAADVEIIMTAHVLYPALDRDSPATFSRRIITELLRDEMGFRGVVATDALDMKAIADRGSLEDNVVRSVLAGCDLLLSCTDPGDGERIYQAIRRGCDSDAHLRARVTHSAARIRALREQIAARARLV